MGRKRYKRFVMWISTLFSFSGLILYPAGQWYLILFLEITFVLFTLSGGSFYEKTRYLPICSVFILLLAFYLMKIRNRYSLSFSVPVDCISSVYGTVIMDSSFTQANNHLMTISLSSSGTTWGQTISAKGLLNVISSEREIITSGIAVKVIGKLNNGYFKATEIQVLKRSFINDFRETIIKEIEKRLVGSGTSEASLLSSMLLLGRADDFSPTVKSLANQCGCSHVLALSGMHLNSLTMVFKWVKSKKTKYILTVAVSSVFVFIAGPRPSLIRAWLMLLLCFLPTAEKLVICFVLQIIIFPYSIMNTGFIYSYLALFALTYIAPMLKETFHCFNTLISSASVIFVIAPIELMTTQVWHPIAILISPGAGFLIMINMFSGFMLLLLGRLGLTVKMNDFIYRTTISYFSFFSSVKSCGWKEYTAFALSFVALSIYPQLKKKILRHRFKNIIKIPIM